MQTKRICLWSGPRNVSTALMYAFAQRSDTQALDEPLYAHYLYNTNRAAAHPGIAAVMASMSTDAEQVVREVILGPCEKPVLFMKQMAHHLINIDRSFLQQTLNVFLIRDPREMLPSLTNIIGKPTLADTGFKTQHDLLIDLRAAGQSHRSSTRGSCWRIHRVFFTNCANGWGCRLKRRCSLGRRVGTLPTVCGQDIGIKMCIVAQVSHRIVRNPSRFQWNWRIFWRSVLCITICFGGMQSLPIRPQNLNKPLQDGFCFRIALCTALTQLLQ